MAYWQIHTKRAYYRHHGNSTRSNCSHDTPVAWCSPPNCTWLKSWWPLYLAERRLGRVRPGWRRCPSDQMFTTQGCQTQKATRRTACDIWLRWSYWNSKESVPSAFLSSRWKPVWQRQFWSRTSQRPLCGWSTCTSSSSSTASTSPEQTTSISSRYVVKSVLSIGNSI